MSRLSFDDRSSTREECWQYDRETAIQDVFEKVNENCATYMGPPEYLAIGKSTFWLIQGGTKIMPLLHIVIYHSQELPCFWGIL